MDGLENLVMIGMLGGPGSGKGTQCRLLAQQYNLGHISIGDVLREEMGRPRSPYAEIIRENMLAGRVGPKEVTTAIVRDHIMRNASTGTLAFVLAGFPCNIEQSDYFEHSIGPLRFLIVLECADDVMIERLAHSDRGRFDDNPENVKRRIETFHQSTVEVINKFRTRNQVKFFHGDQDVDSLSNQIVDLLDGIVEKRGSSKATLAKEHPAMAEDANSFKITNEVSQRHF